jgi:uncharacterized protein YcfJ
MTMRVLKTCAFSLLLLAPVALIPGTASAQSNNGAVGGAAAGAATGAVGGAIVGGPVGAVVGGAAGAIAGGTVGRITGEDRVYVKRYVVEKRYPSVQMDEPIDVGEALPEDVAEYEIEDRPALARYRYAYVNDQVVVVEPRSRKVIEIIE